MWNKAITSLLILSLIYAIFATIRYNNLRNDIESISNDIESIKPDTVTIELKDTLFDTVYVKKPYPVKAFVDRFVVLPCDSDSISLPIEQKHYKLDSVYDIWVSGFQAQIDSAKIYQKIITKTIYSEIKTPVFYKRKGIWFRLEGDDNYFGIGTIKR